MTAGLATFSALDVLNRLVEEKVTLGLLSTCVLIKCYDLVLSCF